MSLEKRAKKAQKEEAKKQQEVADKLVKVADKLVKVADKLLEVIKEEDLQLFECDLTISLLTKRIQGMVQGYMGSKKLSDLYEKA